jgi:5'-3' exonuclease
MRAFHTKKIEFMVAPYESDSQIAKILQLGMADFAITEDSDLIVYNTKVVLKLNQDGDCHLVDLSRWKPEDVDTIYLNQFLKMDRINRL